MTEWLPYLAGKRPLLLYAFLAAGAALENVFPPVPADTFVLLGAFLAATGRAEVGGVFLVTWLANTLGALGVFYAGRRFGAPFFQVGAGRRLLKPHQIRKLAAFYQRYGLWAVFFARFVPGFRAVVPVFAGVTGQPCHRVAPPLVLASGLWYGALTWLGAQAGRNLPAILEALRGTNLVLLAVALVLSVLTGALWRRGWRRGERGQEEE